MDTTFTKAMAFSGTVPALEVTAIKASYDAYIASIKAGHEEIVKELRSEHDSEIAQLKEQYANDIAKVKAELDYEKNAASVRQQNAVSEARKHAEAKNANVISALEAKVREKDEEIETLQADHKRAVEANEQIRTKAGEEFKRKQNQIDSLNKVHSREIRALQAELAVGPNLWVQLQFRNRSRPKPRVYYHRYTATLREATKELVKELGGKEESYVFRSGSEQGPVCSARQTLQELGIKDGAVIYFEKD